MPSQMRAQTAQRSGSRWMIYSLTLREEAKKEMMHNPPHPGEVLKEDVIAPLGLSVTEAAERLAMSRVAFSRVLNCKAGVSPDLAVRLEQAGVSTARAWMAMQANYDLWQAMQHKQPPVRRLQEPATA